MVNGSEEYSRHSPLQIIMFAKIALLCAVACFFAGSSDAQYLASPYVASYAPAYAAYSPYAYGGVYTGYAAGYPAYYGWGSNKGAAPASAPNTGKLTNNQ